MSSFEVRVPPPDGSSGVTRWDVAQEWRWELGDVFDLLIGSRWMRRVRVVRVTDTGPNTREYTLRELDDGHEVFQSEADEEVFDPHRVVRAYAEQQQGRRFGDAEGRHEGRQQVAGGDDGSRWRPPGRQQEHGPDFEGSGGEGRREEADGEGFDGSVGAGRVRAQQAGLVEGFGGARPEGFVLASDRLVPPGGAALGVADDRGLGRLHVECGGGCVGDVAGPTRVPASQGGGWVCDVRSVAAKAFECVHVPRVVADLLRLRDAGVR